jgi:hypothetical protein
LDFPLNIYLLGVFAARHWVQEPEDSKVTFVASGATSSTHKASTSKAMQQNHRRGLSCIRSTLVNTIRSKGQLCIEFILGFNMILGNTGHLCDFIILC